jgi:predicted nucleotidyltransferase
MSPEDYGACLVPAVRCIFAGMEIRHEELERSCERLGVRLLVLFGSHSAGGLPPGPGSDVDVALSFRRDAARVAIFDLHEQLAAAFPGEQLDIVLLHDADPLFRWEILDRATLLYGDVDEFLEYRAFAYRDFMDSADLRALERTLSDRKMNRIRERLRAAS